MSNVNGLKELAEAVLDEMPNQRMAKAAGGGGAAGGAAGATGGATGGRRIVVPAAGAAKYKVNNKYKVKGATGAAASDPESAVYDLIRSALEAAFAKLEPRPEEKFVDRGTDRVMYMLGITRE